MNILFACFKQLSKQWTFPIALILLFGCKKEKQSSIVEPASPYSLTAKPVKISAHCNGFYEYLPEGYQTDASTTKYPLLIFIHGGGEAGSDSASLSGLLINGPLKFVKNGTMPKSFTVKNHTFRFVILAPQFFNADDPYSDEVEKFIEYAKQHYRVDASRIYLTGLSFGGGVCWNYVGKSFANARRIAAMVPIGAYINEARDEFKIDPAKAHIIASSNLAIWSTHNKGDDTCPLDWVTNAYDLLENSTPPLIPVPKLTVFNAIHHEGWTVTYDPTFKENGMNIYEWMLQFHR